LPSYSLFDLGASYKFMLKGNFGRSLTVGGNVFNLFDTTYISESTSNIHSNQTRQNFVAGATGDAAFKTYQTAGTWKGVSQLNQVYFGAGRTWAATLTFNF